jgi:threonine synthase
MQKTIKINPYVKHLQCLQCGEIYYVDDYFEGCPICKEKGKPSNLTMIYSKYDGQCVLPYESYLSMGEGSTPLLPVDNGNHLSFYLKYEGQNPTGSHKDRMSAQIVTRALDKGYRGVAVASSGNAGLSIAAYCAYAGLDCIVVSTKKLNQHVQKLIKNYGAKLILTESSMERWKILKNLTEEGFYPGSNYLHPPVGTIHFGVQGYKRIAYEIVEQMKGTVPSKIIVPTSRGDLLWGVWEGFKELRKVKKTIPLPQMIAVEPFSRLTAVLEGEDYTKSFHGQTALTSIAGSTVTFQSVAAIKESRGNAVIVSSKEAFIAQQQMLKKGIFLEPSSATVVSGYEKLKQNGMIHENDVIVSIGTSSGFIEI